MLLLLVALVLAGWDLGVLTTSLPQRADVHVVRDVGATRSAPVTSLAHVLSWIGSGLVIALVTAAGFISLYRRARIRAALVVALSSMGAAVIFLVDKPLVGRPRPSVHRLEAVTSASFPSGHATLAAALYLALLMVILAAEPRRPIAAAAIVASALTVHAIAASRVYLGVHYLADVAAGVLLGAVWSLSVAALLRRPATP